MILMSNQKIIFESQFKVKINYQYNVRNSNNEDIKL